MITGRAGIIVRVLLVVLFIVAGIVNAESWLMGYRASAMGLASTLIALAAWPIYAVWVGLARRNQAHAWLFPAIFWFAVIVLSVGGWVLLTVGPESTVSGGLSVLGGAALFVGTAAIHGLTRLVDIGGSLPAVVGVSVVMLAVTVFITIIVRHIGGGVPGPASL
ncbi:MAG: hypothetical protein LBN10_10860 [Propionibacteriaceae bacterium]|jgi:hypothetical protein|nr:hypothetical protein [Propionibacteriaceae bacterium]